MTATPGPTEVTVRYAKGGLPDLTAAWAFVMAHLDRVGPSPTVEIHPAWAYGDGHDGERTFSAHVSGTTFVSAPELPGVGDE